MLRRDPAAHISLHNPGALTWLLDSLRAAAAPEQATTLLRRVAAHISLDDPYGVAELLGRRRAPPSRSPR